MQKNMFIIRNDEQNIFYKTKENKHKKLCGLSIVAKKETYEWGHPQKTSPQRGMDEGRK